MDEVKSEAKRRKIALLVLPTTDAIEELKKHPNASNAMLKERGGNAFIGTCRILINGSNVELYLLALWCSIQRRGNESGSVDEDRHRR